MKKSLLLIFLASIVLAGCGSKLTQEQLFEKKQECAKYEEQIKNEIQNRMDFVKSNRLYFKEDDILEEIFYSPEKNSCLYSVYVTQYNMFNANVTCGFYKINDILNGNKEVRSDVIFTGEDKDISCDRDQSKAIYQEKLGELKGQ